MPQVARHIVAGSRALGFALLRRSSEVTTHRIAELYICLTLLAPIPFYSANPSVFQLSSPSPSLSFSSISSVSDTRRIRGRAEHFNKRHPLAPDWRGWLVATEVANGRKARYTHSPSLTPFRVTVRRYGVCFSRALFSF